MHKPIGTETQPRRRIAIISTPRSGNTWLRHLISRLYDLPQVAVHELDDEGWRALPHSCALQLHWRHEEPFVNRLREEGFRIVCLARHPFDVLLSILHISIYGVESEKWLRGQYGDESGLWGAMPRSLAFLDYAKSERARILFSVTDDWWQTPGTLSIRYEDLVHDCQKELLKLQEWAGPFTGESIDQAIEGTSIQNLRRVTGHGQHFWLGKPGLWRELLTIVEARELELALSNFISKPGYTCDPDKHLSGLEADKNWIRYFGHELRSNLGRESELHLYQLQQMEKQIELHHAETVRWKNEADAIHARLIETLEKMHTMHIDLEAARFRLGLIQGCGRFALKVARIIQMIIQRFPHLRKLATLCPQEGQAKRKLR